MAPQSAAADASSNTTALTTTYISRQRVSHSATRPASHNAVLQHVLKLAQNGTQVIYIPGNHDEFARGFGNLELGAIRIVADAIHEAADGRRYLVLHGDGFDCIINHARWLALLGDWAYRFCLGLNRWVNLARRALGRPYWSLSAYLKLKVKNAVAFIGDFEHALVEHLDGRMEIVRWAEERDRRPVQVALAS